MYVSILVKAAVLLSNDNKSADSPSLQPRKLTLAGECTTLSDCLHSKFRNVKYAVSKFSYFLRVISTTDWVECPLVLVKISIVKRHRVSLTLQSPAHLLLPQTIEDFSGRRCSPRETTAVSFLFSHINPLFILAF